MSKITRQDTNGVKPLLATGELGYDNYPAGGDAGRVYVGTGTENIPLAKKDEMLAVDNTAVKLTGNQTIAGIKTFTSSPIVPTPTTNTQAANKAYVDSAYSGFKNYIINGKKVINQRSLTSTDNSYNQDRWYKAGVNWFQGIEGDNNLISGKTYTLSWVGVATASYYVGNTTSATVNAQTFTPIANGGSFTLTISVGQNLWIKFVSDATGSTFNFVQLEEGSVASPFENRPYGLELSLCQRYYESGSISFTAYAVTGARYGQPYRMSGIKRVAPTVVLSDLNAVNTTGAGGPGATTTHLLNNGFASVVGTSYWSATYTASAEL